MATFVCTKKVTEVKKSDFVSSREIRHLQAAIKSARARGDEDEATKLESKLESLVLKKLGE